MEQEEADDRRKIFDIALLADRLRAAAEWLARDPETQSLRLGYFGASTGAAAALVAAARPPEAVGAVVSRGGRPDLAWDDLPAVEASTLLIVGGRDEWGLELNRQALERLHCPKELVVTPGATDAAISGAAMDVPEPGALEEVARLAARWFRRHLEEVSGREQQSAATGSPGRTGTSNAEEPTMPGRLLSLRPEWEDALRDGRKTIDARPVADDIAGLKVGEAVRYPGASMRVRRIRFYPGFGDLLAHEDWRWIAPDAASREEVRRRLEAGHEATVRATGAVAIELELIDHIK